MVNAKVGIRRDKELPLIRSQAYTENMTRKAACHPMFQEAITNHQQLAAGLQLPDMTVLHLLVIDAAQSTLPVLDSEFDSLVSAAIQSGDSLDQWSELIMSKIAAGREYSKGSVSRTPLTMVVEQSQLYLAKQLVARGSSVGVPLDGPQPPPAMPFTSPLHAAASLPSADPSFGDCSKADMLEFLENAATPFDLLTLDSNGKLYTELLQECKEVCTLAGAC